MEILKIDEKNFQRLLRQIIKAIEEEKVLICPTDTVYGLICNATSKKAVKKLFKIKKRRSQKAIPIFVRDIKVAEKLAEINKIQKKFLKSVWPGKVTVVLKSKVKSQKAKVYGVTRKIIALRIPNYKLINILLQKLNRPLTGTSANISGRPASTKIKEVLKQFKNQKLKPDLAVDVGNLPKSKPSTVIDFTSKKPKILRK